MAKDMKARNVLGFQQAEHVLVRWISAHNHRKLVFIGESKVWRNKRKPISKPLNDRNKLTVVLRPRNQNHRTRTCRDVMKELRRSFWRAYALA